MNVFGKIYTLTSFGESHGAAIGGVIDGCPAGIPVDMEFIQHELDRRKPGQSKITTPRTEADKVELLSGVFKGFTTGTPIGFMVRNADAHSNDYDLIKDTYRPSHADFTYDAKYGFRDHRGGGRSSARETIARVVAGAFAKLALRTKNIEIQAYTSKILDLETDDDYSKYTLSEAENNAIRCPDPMLAEKMIALVEAAKHAGDSLGGTITCVIKGTEPGLGEPVFGKLHAKLGEAMLGINAVKGFDYGSGFDSGNFYGSAHNDLFDTENGAIVSKTNRSGGIQGGISNGADIYFRVAFKPTATVLKPQETVTQTGEKTILEPKGRHDPCVLPRAVPIVEAMAAMVVLDALLLHIARKSF
ncbi:MAG TPA: chorismate synthase [Bacteroidales bacterium]|nr:chorismate synthase [Bacteroidales bacterium]